jgi:hypothetical protein
MPRVRIGLTGLACVFLLVLIAAALFGNQRVARHLVPEEPLAELGVTPGGAPPAKPAGGRPAVVAAPTQPPQVKAAGTTRTPSPAAH